MAAWATPSAPPAKHRALVALKTVVRALAGRPGGVVVPAGRPLLQQGASALLMGWVAAGARRACCGVSRVACMHGRSGRRACRPWRASGRRARARACMRQGGPAAGSLAQRPLRKSAALAPHAKDGVSGIYRSCLVAASLPMAPSASFAGMQSAGMRAADLRMLETAAQEAQTTVDAAGELFKALQAEWQARGPAAAAAARPAGAPGMRRRALAPARAARPRLRPQPCRLRRARTRAGAHVSACETCAAGCGGALTAHASCVRRPGCPGRPA